MMASVFSAARVAAIMTATAVLTAFGGPLDKAWLKGETDKDPLSYAPGAQDIERRVVYPLDGFDGLL